ncbi:MAG: hypothetical protein ABR597_15040, partial [Bacteroidales bacterium]
IYGNSLTFSDNQEIRKRINGNINLDYNLNKNHSFAFFTLFSRTDRDRFISRNNFAPGEPTINFTGTDSKGNLNLTTFSLSGDHTFGKISADWSLSKSKSEGDTPY